MPQRTVLDVPASVAGAGPQQRWQKLGKVFNARAADSPNSWSRVNKQVKPVETADQLAIRERFPATVRGRVAGHTEFVQGVDQVDSPC